MADGYPTLGEYPWHDKLKTYIDSLQGDGAAVTLETVPAGSVVYVYWAPPHVDTVTVGQYTYWIKRSAP